MTDLPDMPVGPIARMVRELKVIPPELQPDERVLWSAKANRFQNTIRAVGGRLYLTDRRLVFARHEFDARFGGDEWSAPLVELAEARVRGSMKFLHVCGLDGSVERFVVRPARGAAQVLSSAIAAAR